MIDNGGTTWYIVVWRKNARSALTRAVPFGVLTVKVKRNEFFKKCNRVS